MPRYLQRDTWKQQIGQQIMTQQEITATTAADIPALQSVLATTGLFPAAMLPDMLAPALSGATSDIWLSHHVDGAAIGFCYTRAEEMTEGVWNMVALAVHPSHQGKGTGAALVAATEQRLRDIGARLLIVDTSGTEAFEATRRFYRHNGYEEEGRIRDFWAAGDDKVIFRKPL